MNHHDIGRTMLRTLTIPAPVDAVLSGTYTASGRVLLTYLKAEDEGIKDFYRVATVDDDGTDFHEVFAGVIPQLPGANGVRFMCFADNKRILLGDYVLECTPDMDTCTSAQLLPIQYPPMAGADDPNAMHWSEIVISPDSQYMAWTVLSGMRGSVNLIARLVRTENGYTLEEMRKISSMQMLVPDAQRPGFMQMGVIRGGEIKQFVRGGAALSLVGMGSETRIADSVLQALDTDEVLQITHTPCYDETTIFSPDERLGIVMSTRFSPSTNCAILALLPRPYMKLSLGGLTLPIYMYSVATVRRSGSGNIGPALIDINSSLHEDGYLGVDLSDPENEWVYHSPMSWHPSSKRAMWNERRRGGSEGRVRIVELLDYEPATAVEAVPVPSDIPYATPVMTIEPEALGNEDTFKIAGQVGGYFEASKDGDGKLFRYVDYTDDGVSFLRGEERFWQMEGGYVYEGRLHLAGPKAGEMDLRIVFAQPSLWEAATIDMGADLDGQPKSRGFARYDGKTLKVEDMSR